MPEYLKETLPAEAFKKNPSKVFSGRSLKFTTSVPFTGDKIALTDRSSGKRTDLELKKKTPGSFVIDIPVDQPTGSYALSFPLDGVQQTFPIGIQGLTEAEKISLSPSASVVRKSAMPQGDEKSIRYRTTIENARYWELVFAGHPSDPLKLRYSEGQYLYWSNDGGRRWNSTRLDGLEADPKLAVLDDGTCLVTGLDRYDFDPSQGRSSIGGALWRTDATVSTVSKTILERSDRQFLNFDRPLLATDPASKAIHVFAKYVWFPDIQHTAAALLTSRDGGASFSRTRVDDTISSERFGHTEFVSTFSMVMGDDATLYAAYSRVWPDENLNITMQKTLLRFSSLNPLRFERYPISEPTPVVDNFPRVSTRSQRQWDVYVGPELVIDQSLLSPHRRRLYAIWALAEGFSEDPAAKVRQVAYNYDIVASYSDNGGKNWSNPVRVNDDTGKSDQVFPSVRLDANGTLHMAWLDHREHPDQPIVDAYYAYSIDGGAHFSKNLKVSDEPIGIGQGGRVVGDYLDMIMPYTDRVYIAHPCGSRDGVMPKAACLVELAGVQRTPPLTLTLTPSGNHVIEEGKSLTITVAASDGQKSKPTLTARLANGFSLSTIGASFTDNGNGTGTFQWVPGFDAVTAPASQKEVQVMFEAFRAPDQKELLTSQLVSITVKDTKPTTNQPPPLAMNTARLVSPTTDTFTAPATITLETEVNVPETTITGVVYVVDGKPLALVDTKPYRYTWTNVPAGTYKVKARAVTPGGKTIDTPEMTITVQPAVAAKLIFSPLPPQILAPGQERRLPLTAHLEPTDRREDDDDGGMTRLHYKVGPITHPGVAVVIENETTLILVAKPDAAGQTYTIPIEAFTATGQRASQSLQVTVSRLVFEPLPAQLAPVGQVSQVPLKARIEPPLLPPDDEDDAGGSASRILFKIDGVEPAGLPVGLGADQKTLLIMPKPAHGGTTYSVRIVALTAGGLRAEQTLRVTVPRFLFDPLTTTTITPGTIATVGLTAHYDPALAAEQGSERPHIVFKIVAVAPEGLAAGVVDDATLTVKTRPENVGHTYQITVRAMDQFGNRAEQMVEIRVQTVARPPVLEKIGNLTARVGIPMCIAPAASDPDKHELVYSFTSHNPESQIHEDATINAATGRFCWTARAQDAGKAYDVTLTVTQKQAGGLSASERFTIRVESTIPKQKPMFTKVPDQTVVEGDTVAFTVKAVDPDGGKIVSYDWGKPLRPGESVKAETDPSDGNLILKYRWTGASRTLSPNGKYLLTFSATDDEGEIAVLDVNLDVTAKPQPKLVFHPDLIDRTLAEGETVSFPILRLPEDTSGVPKAVTACAASDIPLGVTMGNNQFQWTPQAGQAGTYPITFTCHGAEIISKTITITVTVGPLTAPQDVQAKALSSTEVEVTWTLPQQGGAGLELTARGPQELHIDLPVTATRYQATQLRPETKYEYVVCTYDTVENQRRKVCANGVSATTPANQPPTFKTTVTDQHVTAGRPLTLTFEATDPDAGETATLRYFVLGKKDIGLPQGIQIIPHPDRTPGKALFTWPAVETPGTYPVTIVVTDTGLNQGSQAALTFNVIVEAPPAVGPQGQPAGPTGEGTQEPAPPLPQRKSTAAASKMVLATTSPMLMVAGAPAPTPTPSPTPTPVRKSLETPASRAAADQPQADQPVNALVAQAPSTNAPALTYTNLLTPLIRPVQNPTQDPSPNPSPSPGAPIRRVVERYEAIGILPPVDIVEFSIWSLEQRIPDLEKEIAVLRDRSPRPLEKIRELEDLRDDFKYYLLPQFLQVKKTRPDLNEALRRLEEPDQIATRSEIRSALLQLLADSQPDDSVESHEVAGRIIRRQDDGTYYVKRASTPGSKRNVTFNGSEATGGEVAVGLTHTHIVKRNSSNDLVGGGPSVTDRRAAILEQIPHYVLDVNGPTLYKVEPFYGRWRKVTEWGDK